MRLEIPSLASPEMDAIGIALVVLGVVLISGTLIFARRSPQGEPDKDETQHNKRDDDGPQGSDTPRGKRRAQLAVEADPDVRQRRERSPHMRNERD